MVGMAIVKSVESMPCIRKAQATTKAMAIWRR